MMAHRMPKPSERHSKGIGRHRAGYQSAEDEHGKAEN
jgi:hypothetical protein